MLALAHLSYALVFVLHYIRRTGNIKNGGLYFILIALIGILSATAGLIVGFLIKNVFNLTLMASNAISALILLLIISSFIFVLKNVGIDENSSEHSI